MKFIGCNVASKLCMSVSFVFEEEKIYKKAGTMVNRGVRYTGNHKELRVKKCVQACIYPTKKCV
jgi:hypothetical protein